MRDFFRLVGFVLFLIVVIIFIGPLLILSVIRGQQKIGPITFNSSQYNSAGRAGMLMLGLALWVLLWGGAALLALNMLVPPVSTPTVAQALAIETPQTAPPTATPTTVTDTPTPVPVDTPTPEDTLTPTPVLPTKTPEPTSTPTPADTPTPSPPTDTPTATPLFNESLVTSTDVPGADAEAETLPTATSRATSPAGSRLNITPQPTLTIVERNQVIAAVQEGNKLLRDAVALANQDNLNNLEGVWQGKALAVVEEFATDLYDRYTQPFTVDFEYISPPVVGNPVGQGQVGVTSREKWSYGGPSDVHEEAFEFIYTLKKQDDEWIIIWYSYRNLPVPSSTPTPTPTAEE